MNWTNIITELQNCGLTQKEIAAKCETGQSYIAGLRNGVKKNPGWRLGNALIALHKEKCLTTSQQNT